MVGYLGLAQFYQNQTDKQEYLFLSRLNSYNVIRIQVSFRNYALTLHICLYLPVVPLDTNIIAEDAICRAFFQNKKG